MIPYIALIGIPFLAQYVVVNRKNGSLRIGMSSYIKSNNVALNTFFLILTFLLVFRKESVGRDLMNYRYLFYKYADVAFAEVIGLEKEVLYYILNWLIGQMTDSYQVFIGVIALLTTIPIAYIYIKDRRNGYVKIILFVNMSTFVMLFSGIRQSLAMAIGMIAFSFVKKKAVWRYLLICGIAIGIHTSAFMLFLMYPLYYANFRKKHLGFIITGIGVVFVFNDRIFSVLGKVLESFTDYAVHQTSTSAYGTLLLYAVLLLFCYVIADEQMMTREAIGYRNYLMLCVVIQCFAPLHALAMRMGYYYILFVPLAVADALEYRKLKYVQIAKTAEIVLSVFFTFIFVWSIYRSYVTGISALDTVPYRFFWER